MNPTDFAQKTVTLVAPPGAEEECKNLAVHQIPEVGVTLSRWRPSFRELVGLVLGRPLWLWVWAGGRTQPPVALEVRPDSWVFPSPKKETAS